MENNIDLTSTSYNRFQSFITNREYTGTFSRLARNRYMYAGVDNGQWPSDVVEKMEEAGYPVHTINFVQGIVDTELGHILQSPADLSITSQNPADTSDVTAMQTLYEIDHANGRWNQKLTQCFLDGLIQRGWIQILPTNTCDVRGNVDFEVIDPAHIYVDPFWISNDIRDINEIFKCVWMTPEQLKANYNKLSEDIDAAITSFENYSSADPGFIKTLFDRSTDFYDTDENRYKVIERHYIVEEKEDVVIDTYSGEVIKKLKEIKEFKGDALKLKLKQEYGNRYMVFQRTVKKSKFITFCPALRMDLCLEEGYYPYQVGHLPYFPWQYRNMYGEPLGMVDLIADAQMMLNKRESQITKILNMRSASNWTIESDAFDNDPAKIRDFQNRINRTGQTFVVTPGSNSQGKIKSLTDAAVVNDLRQQTQVLMDYLQRVTNVTPSMQGQLQSKQESGVLYEQMQSQSMTVMELTIDSIKNFMRDLGAAYIKAALDQYGEMPRSFFDKYSGKQITINMPILDPRTNDIIIHNELGDTDWYAVDIDVKRLSEGGKKQRMASYAAMLNAVSSPIARSILEFEIIKLMDISDESRQELDRAYATQIGTSFAQTESQGIQAMAVSKQAEAALQPQPQAQPAQQQALPQPQ